MEDTGSRTESPAIPNVQQVKTETTPGPMDKTPKQKYESPQPVDKISKTSSVELTQDVFSQLAPKPVHNQEVVVQVESSPTSLCEPETKVLGDEIRTLKLEQQGHDIFSVSPESYSSAEEELKEIHRANESLLQKTASGLVHIKGPVSIKHPGSGENSSESEPSPHFNRRRKLSAASSSSEDLKPDSPDSGDEEFIRIQLMQMCQDEDLSPKDEESSITKQISDKEQHDTRDTERETAADTKLKSEEQSMHVISISESLDETVTMVVLNDNEKEETVPISAEHTMPTRQITDDESLIEDSEDRSKGDASSSVQASSFTPGTASPTSLSSFDEESDSSPSHKKANLEGKQQIKVKHRQEQGLPTIEDSSEGEEAQNETIQQLKKIPEKSKEDDFYRDFDFAPSNLYATGDPQIEDEWQTSEMKVHELSSFSNISPSIESEPENAYTHLLPAEKPLKSAEEAYEEMMEKAQDLKAVMTMTKKVTPPEIEPLYGGMLIEDYAYESLVEEPTQATIDEQSEDQYLSKVVVQETVRQLRTPEEAYEEMQKKKGFMVKEQTTEHAHALQRGASVPAVTDTCYVTMSEYDEHSLCKDEEAELSAEPANEDTLNMQKEVLTPGTSSTQSSPMSIVSPISSSEPSYDSPEVIVIPSSGEDDIKEEHTTEAIEYAMQPYIAESSFRDLSVRTILYPIPDLKITQCSSGEEEAEDEDNITQDYEIPTSADSPYEDAKVIEPLAQTQPVEIEPISVVCEVPQSKTALETVPPVSDQDSTPSPLSPSSSPVPVIPSHRALSSVPGLTKEIPTVIESSQAFVPDSTQVIIPMPDLVSDPSTQVSAKVRDITPTPPEVSVSKPPLAPKPTIVSAPSDISVSKPPLAPKPPPAPMPAVSPVLKQPHSATQQSLPTEVPVTKTPLTAKPVPAPMPADVSVSRPPLAPKPTPKPLPKLEAIIVKMPDEVAPSVTDSALQTTVSKFGILEPVSATTTLDSSTLLSTSTTLTASPDEQIPISVSAQAFVEVTESAVPAFSTSSASVSPERATVPSVTPAPVVQMPDVVSPASECPVQVLPLESTSSPKTSADGYPSLTIAQVPTGVPVQMPDLVASPSQSPSHTANVVPTLPPTSIPTTASTILQATVSAVTTISASIPKDPIEQSSVCPTISEPTRQVSHYENSAPLSYVSASIPSTDRTVIPQDTVSIQIPINNQSMDSSQVSVHASPFALPVVMPTQTLAEHAAREEVPIAPSTMTTTFAFRTLPSQPIQSVPDVQPTIESIQHRVDAYGITTSQSQIVTPAVPTRQDNFVISLPNLETTSVISQTQDILAGATSVEEGGSHPVIRTDTAQFLSSVELTAGLGTDSTFMSTRPEPQSTFVTFGRAEKPIIEFPPPPAASPPALPPHHLINPAVSEHSVPISSCVTPSPHESLKSMTSTAPSVAVKQTVAAVHKPPPPVPPKPVCIPTGLVFSRSREGVRPPVVPEPTFAHASRAATLPRAREPPNALSLSLTAPVDHKYSISSPKSPLSPRFAKTLETYVVITLPSEPGSPVEGITTQAPARRSSLPTPKQQVPAVAPRVFSPSVVSAPVSVVSASLVTAPPKVIYAPIMATLAAVVPVQTVLASPAVTIETPVHTVSTVTTLPVVAAPPDVAPVALVPSIVSLPKTAAQALISVTQPEPPTTKEVIINAAPPVSLYTAPVVVPAPLVTSPHTFFVAPAVAEVPATTESATYTMSSVISAPTMYAASPITASLAMVSQSLVTLPLMSIKTTEVTPTAFTESVTATHPMESTASFDLRHEPERQPMKTVCPTPITISQLPLSTDSQALQGLEMEEVLIVSASEEAISAVGPSSFAATQIQQHESIFEPQQEVPEVYAPMAVPAVPVTYTQFTKSVESQEIRGPDKVVSSMSQMYSAISTTEQHPDTLPNLVTQVVTTEVQRTTTVSVVQERIPLEPMPEPASVAVMVQPEITKTQTQPIQNGKVQYHSDVIDLTTLKVNVTMTDRGMDLTAPESSRQFSSDRQTTAVQPEIVNLSAEITPATTLSVVTDNITIVTCAATITYNNNIADKPLNLGSATSMPLSLAAYKPFEPLAQIVYKPVNLQPKSATSTEIPMNLSCEPAKTTAPSFIPVVGGPVACTKAEVPIHTDPLAVEAIDLTTSKPMKAMVALSSSSGVVTTVVEEDAAPVDLTAGRRAVCCDVLYRLPFPDSCRTQAPVTIQPDNQFSFKDGHYQHESTTSLGIEDLSKMKVSLSDMETGSFPYDKNGFTYQNGASDGAIDLTSAKMSSGQYYSVCVY